MYAFFKQLIQDEAGVTAIEYGLIAALIAIAAIAAMTTLGTSLSSTSATSRSLCKRFVGRRSTALVAQSSAARHDKPLNMTGRAGCYTALGREHKLEDLVNEQVTLGWHPQATITSRLVHWSTKQK